MDLKSFLRPTKTKGRVFSFCVLFSFGLLLWQVWFGFILINVFHDLLFSFMFPFLIPLSNLLFFVGINPKFINVPLFLVFSLIGNLLYFYLLSCVVVLIQEKTVKKTKVPFSLIFAVALILILVLGQILFPRTVPFT
jgi:hypothetical protein